MLTIRAKLRKPIAVPVRKLSVYLQPFCCSSFLKCALQPKIAKINKKHLILEVQGLSLTDVDTPEKLGNTGCGKKVAPKSFSLVSQQPFGILI